METSASVIGEEMYLKVKTILLGVKEVITNLSRKQKRQLKEEVEKERIFSIMTDSWKFLCAGLQGGKLLDRENLTMQGQNSSGGVDQRA